MSSVLLKHVKQYVQKKYVLEIKIWSVNDKKYPHGIKYSFVFIDPKSERKILMDNHYPKTPHVHIDDTEINYTYGGEDRLFSDFQKYVLQHFGVQL